MYIERERDICLYAYIRVAWLVLDAWGRDARLVCGRVWTHVVQGGTRLGVYHGRMRVSGARSGCVGGNGDSSCARVV